MLTYAAASSATANGSKRPAPAKARVAPSAKPIQNSSDASIDETSYRLGGMLSIISSYLKCGEKEREKEVKYVTWSQQITLNTML